MISNVRSRFRKLLSDIVSAKATNYPMSLKVAKSIKTSTTWLKHSYLITHISFYFNYKASSGSKFFSCYFYAQKMRPSNAAETEVQISCACPKQEFSICGWHLKLTTRGNIMCSIKARFSADFIPVRCFSFSSPEPQSFWPAAGTESSGFVQHRKSAIHGLPVKSGQSDWLRIWNEYSCTCSENRVRPEFSIPAAGQKDRGSGDENWVFLSQRTLSLLHIGPKAFEPLRRRETSTSDLYNFFPRGVKGREWHSLDGIPT